MSRLGLATGTQPPRAQHWSPPGLSFLSFPVDPFLPSTGHLREQRKQKEGLGSGFGFSPLIFLSWRREAHTDIKGHFSFIPYGGVLYHVASE